MEDSKPKASSKVVTRAMAPGTGQTKFKQRSTRQFKSKPPKKGVIGFGEDIPGMEWLGTARLLGAALCESPAQFIGLMMLENHMRMSPTHSRQHRKGLDIK
ncbi:unnamed protein product [Leuciscus chuanchicus]